MRGWVGFDPSNFQFLTSNFHMLDNTVGSQQHSIIIGTLLGDGCLERNGTHVRLVIDHSAKQEAYVRWKAEWLQEFSPSVVLKERSDARTERTYCHCVLRTRTSPALERYVFLFYEGKRKCIPKTLPSMMSPQVLATWIMDDGYRRNDCNALRLNTQGYDFAEQQIVRHAFAALSIDATIQKHLSHFVVYIPSHAMGRLRALVRPHLIPSMAYKLA